jgi:hypothetical protein
MEVIIINTNVKMAAVALLLGILIKAIPYARVNYANGALCFWQPASTATP